MRGLADWARPRAVDYVLAAEARGFILGAALARELGCGFVPARKRGKLPWDTVSAEYILEYGVDALEMHADALADGARVLLHDDLLATGGTARALAELAEGAGAQVAGCAFLVELAFLDGRAQAGGLRRPLADLLRRGVIVRRQRVDRRRRTGRRVAGAWAIRTRCRAGGRASSGSSRWTTDAWTSVLRSERGKAVRADYVVEAQEPPRRRAWAQQLEGSPFERLLRSHRTEVALAEAGEGTEVTLTVDQRPRGTARLGGFLVRRATARSLDARSTRRSTRRSSRRA